MQRSLSSRRRAGHENPETCPSQQGWGKTQTSQRSPESELADLIGLKDRIASSDTRVHVDALHRVWTIGLNSVHYAVKSSALDILLEPAGSASDHIRMPAVYAIAEIANSTGDSQLKIKGLAALRSPLQASQVPIRDVAIDALNSITQSGDRNTIALSALKELEGPVRSANNAVRIPAINAIVRAVEGSRNDQACDRAMS